ncbi:MAG: acylphosphatase [Candidatus Geothermincolia bacterium]
MAERVRARVVVRGRVQGVFFRARTRQTARQLGLSGWVRNVRDGSVEALFEGDRDSVEKAIGWCREGPPASVVDSLDVEWLEPGALQGFEVRYE